MLFSISSISILSSIVAISVTSVEHPEAPHCVLDGLQDLPTLLRFWGAGKAPTTLSRQLYLFTLQ
jgi:hypothetical protein